MKIYVICPVRIVTAEQTAEIKTYVEALEKEGHSVHWPPRDVNQDDPTGWPIVVAHRQAMMKCDRVDVFWDKNSSGSHCDIGMALMANKPVKLVKSYQPDTPGKSFIKIMQRMDGSLPP